jgi:excisionase family DNA binding protein
MDISDFVYQSIKAYFDERFNRIESAVSSLKLQGQEEEKPLTRKEAAAELNINLSTLNHYTKTGRLKAHFLGNKVFYFRSEINDALKNSKTK